MEKNLIKVEFTYSEVEKTFEHWYSTILLNNIDNYLREKKITIKLLEDFCNEKLKFYQSQIVEISIYEYEFLHNNLDMEITIKELLECKIPIILFELLDSQLLLNVMDANTDELVKENDCHYGSKFYYLQQDEGTTFNKLNIRKIGKLEILLNSCIALAMVMIIKHDLQHNYLSDNFIKLYYSNDYDGINSLPDLNEPNSEIVKTNTPNKVRPKVSALIEGCYLAIKYKNGMFDKFKPSTITNVYPKSNIENYFESIGVKETSKTNAYKAFINYLTNQSNIKKPNNFDTQISKLMEYEGQNLSY